MALKPDGVFLDVGTNLGQTLLDYVVHKKGRSYIGFEPNLICANHIRAIIAGSRLENCTLVPVALSDANGVFGLHAEWGSDPVAAEATIMSELRPGRQYSTQFVPALRLDDILQNITGESISFIKIDVEGAELLALRGMEKTLRNQEPWVTCEILRRDSNASREEHAEWMADIIGFIASIGYTAYQIIKSTDARHFSGLRAVSAFPDDVWSQATKEENDYLLTPADADPSADFGMLNVRQ